MCVFYIYSKYHLTCSRVTWSYWLPAASPASRNMTNCPKGLIMWPQVACLSRQYNAWPNNNDSNKDSIGAPVADSCYSWIFVMGCHTLFRRKLSTVFRGFFLFFLFFFFLSFFFYATPVAYGESQARGRIRAIATGLHHSHSNSGSKPRLQPTPQLMANAGSLTHWARPRIKPTSSRLLVRFISAEPQQDLPSTVYPWGNQGSESTQWHWIRIEFHRSILRTADAHRRLWSWTWPEGGQCG